MEKDGDQQCSLQKNQGDEEISKIEDFTKPITVDEKMNIGIFWDVEDYPFPDGTRPEEMYEKIKSGLDSKEGLLSIWAYVDENNPSSAKYLGEKTWKSRLYFLAAGEFFYSNLYWCFGYNRLIDAGNKRQRRIRMFNDISLWKLDLLPWPAARLFVISDGIKSSDNVFYEMIQRLGSIGFNATLYMLPSKDHQPENPQWTQLCGDNWVELVHPEFGRRRV